MVSGGTVVERCPCCDFVRAGFRVCANSPALPAIRHAEPAQLLAFEYNKRVLIA